VALRDLDGGSVVEPAALQVVRVPPGVVPAGAFTDPTGPAGRTVVVDVPARAVLTSAVLLDSAARAGPGRVALPVRFGEAAAVALLDVGSRIDVLGPDASGAGYGVVAADVRVLALPRAGEDGLLTGSGSSLVLLEVTAAQAAAVTAAGSVSAVGFALR
jgi:Flp pilus assembly protein CpaB